ncbi:hypothetical protein PCANB_001185 [Pneumocystis canis]|nr:hypothetical protein PCK1_001236 [Pneumocystis canis]KAG5437064.1 hypothetical protein PCANB_001185 [Pneumocystis canis]
MSEDSRHIGFLDEEYYDSYDFECLNDNKKEQKKMTETEFIEEKKVWKPKIEDKYILSKICIPIPRPANKFSLLTLKSAAEEQYYLRNYQLSLDYVNDLLKPKNPDFEADCSIYGVERKEMEYLRNRCIEKLSYIQNS